MTHLRGFHTSTRNSYDKFYIRNWRRPLRIGKYVDQRRGSREMEELEAIAGLLDVLDEFPECGTDNISETERC
jgi:hypothetical protein